MINIHACFVALPHTHSHAEAAQQSTNTQEKKLRLKFRDLSSAPADIAISLCFRRAFDAGHCVTRSTDHRFLVV